MILITGASGMLGAYVLEELRNTNISFDAPSRKQLNISSLEEIRNFFSDKNYEVIIHLAAETDVDLCEREPNIAYQVNTLATKAIAQYAAKMNAYMIYISTSAVFGGTNKLRYSELDFPIPGNFYGGSKFFGEQLVCKLSEYLIIRASWMIGGGPHKDSKFISKILPRLKDGQPVAAVHDKWGSLTYAKELAAFIVQSLDKRPTGIKHFSSNDYCSRFEIAQLIANYINSKSVLNKADSQLFPLSAPRPMSEALYTLTPQDFSVMRWQDVIKDYLNEWL